MSARKMPQNLEAEMSVLGSNIVLDVFVYGTANPFLIKKLLAYPSDTLITSSYASVPIFSKVLFIKNGSNLWYNR